MNTDITMAAELRGRALVTVILLTSGVDFLLFGVRGLGNLRDELTLTVS